MEFIEKIDNNSRSVTHFDEKKDERRNAMMKSYNKAAPQAL